MHSDWIIELICSFVQELLPNEVKTMYNSCTIELFCLTNAFYTKKKVNTMHNECIMELICSFVQESPKNKVKTMYNSYIIGFSVSLNHSVLKARSIQSIKVPNRAHMLTCAKIT